MTISPQVSLIAFSDTSEMLECGHAIQHLPFSNARIVETHTSTKTGLMGFECPENGADFTYPNGM